MIGYATALRKLGRGAEAVKVLNRVLAADPNNVLALVNRGHILSDLHAYADAIASYEKALKIEPTNRQARSPLAWAALAICDWAVTEPLIEDLKTQVRDRRSVVQPFTFLACSDNPELQRACAQSFVTDFVPVLPRPLCSDSPRPARRGPSDRIRIGYLSADFRLHPTAHLVARLLELHDRSKFTVLGVSTGEDDASGERRRIAGAVDEFLDVPARPDRETAELIHERGVDILVDLNAHTRSGRLGILANRPAPLQVNYLGYPGTAGARFVDYIIADETILPDGSDAFFTEQIVRLPSYYVGYHLGKEISQIKGSAQTGRLASPLNFQTTLSSSAVSTTATRSGPRYSRRGCDCCRRWKAVCSGCSSTTRQQPIIYVRKRLSEASIPRD